MIYGIGRLTQVGLEALVQSTYKECKTLETVADLRQESKDAIVRAEKKLESEFGDVLKMSEEAVEIRNFLNSAQSKLGYTPPTNLNFTNFTANPSDAFLDIIIHYSDGKYIISREGSLTQELNLDELANLINTAPSGKSVRLLSCNDLDAARELSKLTQQPFYASDGWVELDKAGNVFSEKPFVKLEKGVASAGPAHTPGNAKGVEEVDFVRLGVTKTGTKVIAELPLAIREKVSKFTKEVQSKFLDDYFNDVSDVFRKAVESNPELVNCWKKLEGVGADHLRKNKGFLDIIYSYANGTVIRKLEQYGLTLEEESIIRYYTGPSYAELNKALEGVGELTDELIEYNNLLKKGLQKLPDYHGEVFRGLGKTESAIAQGWVEGQEVTFKSFKSTSRSIEEADNFMFNSGGNVSLIINSKTGKAIDNVSLAQSEVEILFGPNKRFRIDKVTYRPRFEESDPLIKEITLTEI